MNKGFQIASGEICAYLNSDDIYIGNILWEIAEKYLKDKFKWIYTDVLFGNSIKNSKYFERRISSFEEFCAIQTIAQQGVFWENNSLKTGLTKIYCMLWIISFLLNYIKILQTNLFKYYGSIFRIHEDSKTSKFENILFNERKNRLKYADISENKYQKNKIILEIKRLELKIKMHKKYSDMLVSKKLLKKIKYFLLMLIIFIKSPFKLRDLFFLGYLKKAIIYLLN